MFSFWKVLELIYMIYIQSICSMTFIELINYDIHIIILILAIQHWCRYAKSTDCIFFKFWSLISFPGRATPLPALTPASTNTCGGGRLCRTRYNTTAPMYGVSLTSGQPVTIVQKFPDLLQQVVFEVCEWVYLPEYKRYPSLSLSNNLGAMLVTLPRPKLWQKN